MNIAILPEKTMIRGFIRRTLKISVRQAIFAESATEKTSFCLPKALFTPAQRAF
jgi:hypothetical protein